jgi:hypothetical protein
MAAIDDATGVILAAGLFLFEGTEGYLWLLRQIVTRYGILVSIYQDRHGSLKRNMDFMIFLPEKDKTNWARGSCLTEENSSFMPNTLSHKSGLSHQGLRFLPSFYRPKKWKYFIPFSQNDSAPECLYRGDMVLIVFR